MRRNIVVALIIAIIFLVGTFIFYESTSTTTISRLVKDELDKNNYHGLTIYITGADDNFYRKDINDEYLPLIIDYLDRLKIKGFSPDRQKKEIKENLKITKYNYTPYNIFFNRKEKYGRLVITTLGSNLISISYNDKFLGVYEITNGNIDYEFLDSVFEKLQIYNTPKI